MSASKDDDEIRRLLEDERAFDPEPYEPLREEVWRRVADSGARRPGAAQTDTRSGSPWRAVGLAGMLGGGAIGVLFALARVTGMSSEAMTRADAGPARQVSTGVFTERRAVAVSAPAPSGAIASGAPAAPPTSLATTGGSLAAERRLLDEARTAFNHGKSDVALAALERHARLFPAGVLAEERDALRVRALVAAGNVDAARVRARAFRVRYPQSMFAPAIEAAIRAGGVEKP